MADTVEGGDDGFFFRQLLPGRDLAVAAANANQQHLFTSATRMMNCIYLVGDRKTGDCIVVDPCWDIDGIKHVAKVNRMRLVAVVATHAHPDHIGGYYPFPLNLFLQKGAIPGIKELVNEGLQVYMHGHDIPTAVRQTEVFRRSFVPMHHEQIIKVGRMQLKCLHTPGHCPGSVCLLMMDEHGRERGLLSGDTLLPGTFGRVDLPGSSPSDMLHSLQTLSALNDETVVYPGHHYNRLRHTSIGREKVTGFLNPSHEIRLKSAMQPKMMFRLLYPVVSCVYPVLQCSRFVPFMALFGCGVFMRTGFWGILAYAALIRLVVAYSA